MKVNRTYLHHYRLIILTPYQHDRESFQRPHMAFFTINDTLHQNQLFSITLCKYPSTLNTFKFDYSSLIHTFSPPKHTLQPKISPLFVARAHGRHINAKLPTADHELSTKTTYIRTSKENSSGVSILRSRDEGVDGKYQKTYVSSVVEEETDKSFTKDRYSKKRVDSINRREMSSGFSSMRPKEESLGKKIMKTKDSLAVKEKMGKIFKKGDDNKVREEKMGKGCKKSKVDMQEAQLKVALDMCSKRGDVMGAIALYDSAQREGIKMGQYHFTVLLYLCSSAAVGVVRPAKSGSGSRSLNTLDLSSEASGGNSVVVGEFGERGKGNFSSSRTKIPSSNDGQLVKSGKSHGNSDKIELNSNTFPLEVSKVDVDSNFSENKNLTLFSNGFLKPRAHALDKLVPLSVDDDDSANIKDESSYQEDNEIRVSGDVKKYALQRGFEIYEKMCLEQVPMNEATLTSVARMAMSVGNGDVAFDMVKQMKPLGLNPRLRSYGPALSAFCSSGDIDKAFAVEEHMLQHGVYPEEPELEALLKVSIAAGKSDKVYYLLHKLRTSLRKVPPSTADLIEKWFKSKAALRMGKRKWDKKLIMKAMENGGGGWHGQGWLGTGKWTVSHTTVGDDGLCKCCGEKLATIDLDPLETENFAESVASIAIKREKNSSFQKFQKWLDYYGPFEAVVDAANVGLFSQRRFVPSKINAVVNGIRQKLPSKKWPLIVLHNKRITGHKMGEPVNKALIEKWKNADALYPTPTGSNDDWYWLYAAIKFKCLIVTNDEMRDHTFQLLGNDFFPKWKERHQVHFSFSDAGPVFHMPPPCSVVIQESEKGHWHIPVVSEHDYEGERTWLCVTRANSLMTGHYSGARPEESLSHHYDDKGRRSTDTQTELQIKPPAPNHNNRENTKKQPQEIYKNLRDILSATVFSNHTTIFSEIEAAEKLGNCIIDFQI